MSFHDKLLTILVPAQYELSDRLRGCQLVCEDGICFLCSYCVQLILLGWLNQGTWYGKVM